MVVNTLNIDFPITLSKEMVASYDLSGYLVTPRVLSPEEIERYGVAVDSEVGVRTQKDRRSVAEKSLY